MSCYWEKEGNGGACFSSFLLKRIAALDLALGVTMYFLEEPDEELIRHEELAGGAKGTQLGHIPSA